MRHMIRHGYFALVIAALATITTGTAAAAFVAPQSQLPAVQSISPSNGALVGIADPVTIDFAAPVADRALAERAVTVSADRPLAGAYAWNGNRELVWTPTRYLPVDTQFTVRAGTAHTQFRSNGGTRADADMSAHTFTVFLPGQGPRVMLASMGKPGHETPVGTFPVLQRQSHVIMDSSTIGIPVNSSEGYRLDVYYAERLTWGGVYVHSAPWSVNQQGHSNVSHGCINLAPADAQWYYNNVGIGDPVTVHW
ncbi:lipoprotein-anchoring transpeptidase ErfK/SrfK [Nocardia sp. GAS34]|uniref:L,D-transpeptidase n=1 Tax=unclassified Nocardia TaxID=2637762 RepID=UPI003D2390F3